MKKNFHPDQYLDAFSKISFQTLLAIEDLKLKTNIIGLNISYSDYENIYSNLKVKFDFFKSKIIDWINDLIKNIIPSLEITKIFTIRSINNILYELRKRFGLQNYEPINNYDNFICEEKIIMDKYCEYENMPQKQRLQKNKQFQESIKDIKIKVNQRTQETDKTIQYNKNYHDQHNNNKYYSKGNQNLHIFYEIAYKKYMKTMQNKDEAYLRLQSNNFLCIYKNIKDYQNVLIDNQQNIKTYFKQLSSSSSKQISQQTIPYYKPSDKKEILNICYKKIKQVPLKNKINQKVKINKICIINKDSVHQLPPQQNYLFNFTKICGKSKQTIRQQIKLNRLLCSSPISSKNSQDQYIIIQQNNGYSTDSLSSFIIDQRLKIQSQVRERDKRYLLRRLQKQQQQKRNIKKIIEAQKYQDYISEQQKNRQIQRRIRKQQQRQQQQLQRLQSKLKNSKLYSQYQNQIKQLEQQKQLIQKFKFQQIQKKNANINPKVSNFIQNYNSKQKNSFQKQLLKKVQISNQKKTNTVETHDSDDFFANATLAMGYKKNEDQLKKSNSFNGEGKFQNNIFMKKKPIFGGGGGGQNFRKLNSLNSFIDFNEPDPKKQEQMMHRSFCGIAGQKQTYNQMRCRQYRKFCQTFNLKDIIFNRDPNYLYRYSHKILNDFQKLQKQLNKINQENQQNQFRSFFGFYIKQKLYLVDKKHSPTYQPPFKGPEIISLGFHIQHQTLIYTLVTQVLQKLKKINTVIIYSHDIIVFKKFFAQKNEKRLGIRIFYFQELRQETKTQYEFILKTLASGYVYNFDVYDCKTRQRLNSRRQFYRCGLLLNLVFPSKQISEINQQKLTQRGLNEIKTNLPDLVKLGYIKSQNVGDYYIF